MMLWTSMISWTITSSKVTKRVKKKRTSLPIQYFEGILPDSPPDSGSEHCQLSPHYLNSPPDDVANMNLYSDPVMYGDTAGDGRQQVYGDPGNERGVYIPDLSSVDYDQPLQIVESVNMMVEPVRNTILRQHAAPVLGVNNNGVGHMVYREHMSAPVQEVKQEPPSTCSSPSQEKETVAVSKPVVNKRKKRGASEDINSLCESSAVKIKSEPDSDQILHFTPFQPSKWRETFTSECQNLKTPVMRVSADKGFNFSHGDDAFIAQKKNHFQLSCHLQKEGDHVLVNTDAGPKKIDFFQLNFYGVKKEAPEQRIQVCLEQCLY